MNLHLVRRWLVGLGIMAAACNTGPLEHGGEPDAGGSTSDGGGGGGGDAGTDTTPPTVTMVPGDGAVNVPTTTSLGFTFTRTMDIATVAVTARVGALAYDLGAAGWSGNNTLLAFGPPAPLAAGQSYAVTVDGKDLHGVALATAHFTFATLAAPPGPPRIVISRSFPNPNSTTDRVAASSAIVLAFSRPMNPATFTMSSPPAAADTFRLYRSGSTLTACGCVWSASNTVVTCTPAAPMASNTFYVVTLKNTVAAADGMTMDFSNLVTPVNSAGYEPWSFTTEVAPDTTPPAIVSASPTSGAAGVAPGTNDIRITFSKRMDQASVQAAFSIVGPTSPNLNGGLFFWDDTGTVMTYEAPSFWPYGAAVTWQVGTGARSSPGQIALASTYTASFQVLYTRRASLLPTTFESCSGYVFNVPFAGDPGTPGVYTSNGSGNANLFDVGYFTRAANGTVLNLSARGFFCFDLPTSNVTRVVSAILYVHANGWSGTPSNLGALYYDNVWNGPNGVLGASAYGAAASATVYAPFMTAAGGDQQKDIAPLATSALLAKVAQNLRMQVRLSFALDASAAPGDGFNPILSGSKLDLRYESTEGPNSF